MTPSETYTLDGLLLLLCDVDVVGTCWWVALLAVVAFVQELQECLLVLVDELQYSRRKVSKMSEKDSPELCHVSLFQEHSAECLVTCNMWGLV